MVLILLILFSICPLILALLKNTLGVGVGGLSTVTTNGDISGYSVVNYFVMYCIGAISNEIRLNTRKSAICFAVCFIPLLLMELGLQYHGLFKGIAHSYCNPLTVGCAFFSMMFFSSIKMRNIEVINRISIGSLMVYLTHKYFLPLFKIKEYASRGGFVILFHLVLVCVSTYVFGWLLSELYRIALKPVNHALVQKMNRFVIETKE